MTTEPEEITDIPTPVPTTVNEHSHSECEGCKTLKPIVDDLTSKVQALTPSLNESSEEDVNPDTKPHSVPWTHRGGGHYEH
jgi:hypothetical protein